MNIAKYGWQGWIGNIDSAGELQSHPIRYGYQVLRCYRFPIFKEIPAMKLFLSCCALFLTLMSSAQLKTLKVEPNHSTISFDIGIAGFTKVTGVFTDYSLEMDWDMDSLELCKIDAVIQVSSINTGIPDRDAHLRTADFFDEEQFPSIDFSSDSIVQVDFSHFEAHGKLTMHGVTKDLVIPFQLVKADGNTMGFSAQTTIKRSDYSVGASFQHDAIPDFISDDIQVWIDFWTKKRKVE